MLVGRCDAMSTAWFLCQLSMRMIIAPHTGDPKVGNAKRHPARRNYGICGISSNRHGHTSWYVGVRLVAVLEPPRRAA